MAASRRQLDAELLRRHMADSRAHARELIASGSVRVSGLVATSHRRRVSSEESVSVRREPQDTYASRGALKLIGALDAFIPAGLRPPSGRMALDAGASTGGFTDVLLRRGAARVIAVDVGYGQLRWNLRNDSRVTVMDRTNVRTLTPESLPFPPDLIVADLSFISLTRVLPSLVRLVAPLPPADSHAGAETDMAVGTDTHPGADNGTGADLLLMVKPQFELDRDRVDSGGVVSDPDARAEAVLRVSIGAAELGWGTRDAAVSALPGPAGNIECFLWLRRGGTPLTDSMLADLLPQLGSA